MQMRQACLWGIENYESGLYYEISKTYWAVLETMSDLLLVT